MRQAGDSRPEQARQRDHAIGDDIGAIGQLEHSGADGGRPRTHADGDPALDQQLRDRPAGLLAEHPQRRRLRRDDGDHRLGAAAPQLGGGHDRELIGGQGPGGGGRDHERDPRAVLDGPFDGRDVRRPTEGDRALERGTGDRADGDQELVVANRLAEVVDHRVRVGLDACKRPAMQVEPRVPADRVERQSIGQAEPERGGDGCGSGCQLGVRGQDGDAGKRSHERAQRGHRFDSGDPAARDDDVWRRRTSHDRTVRPPRRSAIRIPPRRTTEQDGSAGAGSDIACRRAPPARTPGAPAP